MTDQKRPVLTLKRRTEGDAPVRSRKTVINVTTPPKWKVKKQKLSEKAAREAELAVKKAQAGQELALYLKLTPLDEAVSTLKLWWPDTPRLFVCGVREALFEDAARRGIPLSHKKIIRALKAIARSESYLGAMKTGACRYDTEGYVTEHITVEEEQYALARLAKVRAQNARKAELAQTV
ncbi:TPA: fertility inhibition protein FinO [Salmonella enterica]|nr:fertility inhibition protein FinO [Salmonella enterica]